MSSTSKLHSMSSFTKRILTLDLMLNTRTPVRSNRASIQSKREKQLLSHFEAYESTVNLCTTTWWATTRRYLLYPFYASHLVWLSVGRTRFHSLSLLFKINILSPIILSLSLLLLLLSYILLRVRVRVRVSTMKRENATTSFDLSQRSHQVASSLHCLANWTQKESIEDSSEIQIRQVQLSAENFFSRGWGWVSQDYSKLVTTIVSNRAYSVHHQVTLEYTLHRINSQIKQKVMEVKRDNPTMRVRVRVVVLASSSPTPSNSSVTQPPRRIVGLISGLACVRTTNQNLHVNVLTVRSEVIDEARRYGPQPTSRHFWARNVNMAKQLWIKPNTNMIIVDAAHHWLNLGCSPIVTFGRRS